MYGDCGHVPVGFPLFPTKTMFQTPPVHVCIVTFRVKNCCWLPETTVPSIFESAMNPPLAHSLGPPSGSKRFTPPDVTWMRRSAVACETAHTSWLLIDDVGVTDRLEARRQKFSVALPWFHFAIARTAPVMETSSGAAPSPRTSM